MKFLPKLYLKIRNYITSKVQLIKSQLEVSDPNFQPIHEDNLSLPTDADLKRKFNIFNMGVKII